jgi:hypothetical protein
MARAAAASSHRDDQDTPAQGESKASKRRCVQSACVPCRKRKSKVSAIEQLVMAQMGDGRIASADQSCIAHYHSSLQFGSSPAPMMAVTDAPPTVRRRHSCLRNMHRCLQDRMLLRCRERKSSLQDRLRLRRERWHQARGHLSIYRWPYLERGVHHQFNSKTSRGACARVHLAYSQRPCARHYHSR